MESLSAYPNNSLAIYYLEKKIRLRENCLITLLMPSSMTWDRRTDAIRQSLVPRFQDVHHILHPTPRLRILLKENACRTLATHLPPVLSRPRRGLKNGNASHMWRNLVAAKSTWSREMSMFHRTLEVEQTLQGEWTEIRSMPMMKLALDALKMTAIEIQIIRRADGCLASGATVPSSKIIGIQLAT